MLTVKILGSGCANCRKLEAVAREAAAGAGLEAEFVKVTDMKAIMAYDLLVHARPGDQRQAGEQRPHPHAGRGPAVDGGLRDREPQTGAGAVIKASATSSAMSRDCVAPPGCAAARPSAIITAQ